MIDRTTVDAFTFRFPYPPKVADNFVTWESAFESEFNRLTLFLNQLGIIVRSLQLPQHSTASRDAIKSPQAGFLVMNTTTGKLNFYDGTAWRVVTSV